MRVLIAGIVLTQLAAVPADAQTIGTFRWRLDPFCDVVTFTVTVDGAGLRLTGYDEACGAAKVPAAGVVVPNPDGTFTMAFYLVTAQGLASHTTATLVPPTYSGPWRDASGLTGTLSFGGGSGGGGPRPVVPFQQRVTGMCTGSEFVQKVREDGGVECGATPAGGDITSVIAGVGLTGGGTSDAVTLGIATGGVGSAQIADGSIGAADVDASQVQRRITGACASGTVMSGALPGGAPICSTGTALVQNTALGTETLTASPTGQGNVALGYRALRQHTTGAGNIAVGAQALELNTTGHHNAAIGTSALRSNTTGALNIAIGQTALTSNVSGEDNVALGYGGLAFNLTGDNNIAIGSHSLYSNTSGEFNTALGASALVANTDGAFNVAVGPGALIHNTGGDANVAVGLSALQSNLNGFSNIAVGEFALGQMTAGGSNVALGSQAGLSLTTGSSNIFINNQGAAVESNTTRIGTGQTHAFISGIRGRTTGNANAVAVLIDSTGQLGTVSSSRRTKEDIEDMAGASAALFRLRPVTFRYIQPYADGSKPVDYGLIAEEVEEVYPDLVVRNDAGAVETVQYHKLVPMLLNELQRLRRDLETQRRVTRSLQRRLARLESTEKSEKTEKEK